MISFLFLKISLIIYLSLAVQGLGCGSGAFSGCGERGSVHVLLIASALGAQASVVVAHGQPPS